MNGIRTVRYLECHVPSATHGDDERVQIGKNLTPFLAEYTPCLQTLCLWRHDDFAWTSSKFSLKKNLKQEAFYKSCFIVVPHCVLFY